MEAEWGKIISSFFSDLTFLRAIWLSSIVLGALSSFTMVGLVVARAINNKRDEKLQAHLKKLRLRIMEFMESGSDLETLQQNFKGENIDHVREMVMQLLGSVKGDTRDLLIALLWGVGVRDKALKSIKIGDDIEKQKAIEVLSLFSDMDVLAALHMAMDDENQNIRLMAAEALAENDPGLSVTELVEKLDIGGTVRSRMLREIFLKVGRNHVKDLVDLLEGVAIEDIAVLTLYAIGRVQDYSAVPAIVKQMKSKHVNVRAEALRALNAIGHPKCMPAVVAAIYDEAWPVRAQAAVCAGNIGFVEAIEPLIELLDDEEWWARFRAAEALVKLGANGMAALKNASNGTGRSAQIAQLVLSEKEAA
ncbi:MAG: HEAT repeat domain-containing protein [Rhodospirillaceae bacterium]|nr:HEAT repeat domain-containing protein [Nitrosopumilus sp.]MDH5771888.1 HEAT repeat domain-containing protein [Rhodospirillaceae bacterium]